MNYREYDTAPETLPSEALRRKSLDDIHEQFGNADLTAWYIKHLAPQPGERIIDLGCGVGLLSVPLAKRVAPDGRIMASDDDDDLKPIWEAINEANDLPLHFIRQDFSLDWPWPNHSVDAIVAHFSISTMPDQELALRELQRVLRPGGRAMVVGSAPDDQADFRKLHLELAGEHPTAEMIAYGHDMVSEVLPALDKIFGAGERITFVNELRFNRPLEVMEFYATGKLYGLLSTDADTRDNLLDLIFHAAEDRIMQQGSFTVTRRLVGAIYHK